MKSVNFVELLFIACVGAMVPDYASRFDLHIYKYRPIPATVPTSAAGIELSQLITPWNNTVRKLMEAPIKIEMNACLAVSFHGV